MKGTFTIPKKTEAFMPNAEGQAQSRANRPVEHLKAFQFQKQEAKPFKPTPPAGRGCYHWGHGVFIFFDLSEQEPGR